MPIWRPRSRWAEQSPGGLLMPNQSLLYTGHVLASSQLNPMMHVCRELCGGQICVTPDFAAFQDPETAPWLEKYYTINEDWRSEDRRRRLAFARDPLNSDYAGHRLTFRLFAQSPPFAHLTAVYRKFRLGRTAPLRPQVRWPFGPGARRHRSAAVAHNRRVA
jgi:4-hydroxyphenylacetate 3-monooxygenase